uniref:Bm236 n=1 Tax=Brugia malayi TaxID=6279 RepID=A0A1I9GCU2_BRUMA|nr:Bm236 [Brugia malayi]
MSLIYEVIGIIIIELRILFTESISLAINSFVKRVIFIKQLVISPNLFY